ncbi:MAG: histidine--tRNA ligase [Acidimicrobiia bacterium]|nr:histidine--tRNA ligase [Acidimicrobiia bacterium]MBA3982801.1 histidine--tRNA ligase [Acidimicrobiia bacterium]
MPEFRTTPGFRDLLPPASTRQRAFVDVFAGLVERAGYDLVVPPMLEDIGVFERLGKATDVVTKEMYDFVDKGDRHVVMRPEQTASLCRAFVEHRPPTPWKVWYAGPNFRYDRPQRGRYRQFDQVDVEVLGTDDPEADVEVISLGWRLYEHLGLRQVTLAVNSLGAGDDKARHLEALTSFLSQHAGDLSTLSRDTLARNPLRVLDSKRPDDAEIVAAAPTIDQFWSDESARHFDAVLAGLRAIRIPFVVQPRLVRGLDYYVRTAFEYVGGTLESAQNALGGGGRYDGLVEALGGPPTPGVGFALGVDRTLLACDDEGVFPPPSRSVDVFVVDTTGGRHATVLADRLRASGWHVERSFDSRSMKSQMKSADRSGAEVAVIIGADEAASGTAVARPLRTDADQSTVELDVLEQHLDSILTTVAPVRDASR